MLQRGTIHARRRYGRGEHQVPRHATAHVEDSELKMTDLASPEEMARRKQVVARLRSRMAAPVTETDRGLWREFMAELEKERVTFRS